MAAIAACAILLGPVPADTDLSHEQSPPRVPITQAAPAAVGVRAPATAPRTLNGHFARVTYPVTVTSQERIRIEVTLRHLRGRTPKDAYRRIRLMGAEHGTRWQRVTTVHPKMSGRLVFRVPAPRAPGGYRARLELVRSGAKTITTAPFRIIVRDPSHYLPRGDAADWASISGTNLDGSIVRWDPCSTVRWVYNPNGTEAVYPQAIDDLSLVFSRISRRTGLRFQYVGSSTKVPYKSSDQILPADDQQADLFVAFADKYEVNTFDSAVVGLGGPLYYKKAIDNTLWIDSGGVLLDKSMIRRAPYRNSTDYKNLLSLMTHEVLHAVGLGHAKGEWQVMYPALRDTARFGAGDLGGMTAHGSTHGCAPGFPDVTATDTPSRTALPAPMAPTADTMRALSATDGNED